MATSGVHRVDAGEAAPPRPRLGRVLGVDPGLHVTGYAVIEQGRGGGGPFVVEAGVIRPRGAATKTTGGRLKVIHEGVLEVLDAFGPDSMAIEQVHSHPAHPRTAILMAHARGAIMLAAALRGVEVCGYPASRIKKTLTGSGRAPKDQMQHAVRTELRLDVLPEPHDVADACAVALCHYQYSRNLRAYELG